MTNIKQLSARAKHIFLMIYGFVLYIVFVKVEEWFFNKSLPYIGYFVHHPKPFKWHEPYDVNKCVCPDENGKPLNQCHECPR